MIPLSLIKRFASTDLTRYHITEPWVVGDVIVATNGRVLVEVPVAMVDTEGLVVLEGVRYPDYRPLLDGAFWPVLRPVLFALEGKSEDHMTMVECRECKGTGDFSEPGDCEECGGIGKWPECDWDVDFPGGSTVKGLYAEQILTLPAARWYLPISPESMIPFAFGELGRGVLMPMRSLANRRIKLAP